MSRTVLSIALGCMLLLTGCGDVSQTISPPKIETLIDQVGQVDENTYKYYTIDIPDGSRVKFTVERESGPNIRVVVLNAENYIAFSSNQPFEAVLPELETSFNATGLSTDFVSLAAGKYYLVVAAGAIDRFAFNPVSIRVRVDHEYR